MVTCYITWQAHVSLFYTWKIEQCLDDICRNEDKLFLDITVSYILYMYNVYVVIIYSYINDPEILYMYVCVRVCKDRKSKKKERKKKDLYVNIFLQNKHVKENFSSIRNSGRYATQLETARPPASVR